MVEIDREFEVDDYMDKSKTYHYSPAIKAYLDKHAVFTYYSINFKRNENISVDFLRARFPSIDKVGSLEPLPCPIPDKNNPDKYLCYEEIKKVDRDFSDEHQPAKHKKTPSNIPFTKNKLRALYGAHVEVICEQCGKRRVVYFKYKPSKDQLREAADAVEYLRYICGGRMSSFGRALAVVEEITCGKIVEILDEIDNEQMETVSNSTVGADEVGTEDSEPLEKSIEDMEDEVTDLNANCVMESTPSGLGISNSTSGIIASLLIFML